MTLISKTSFNKRFGVQLIGMCYVATTFFLPQIYRSEYISNDIKNKLQNFKKQFSFSNVLNLLYIQFSSSTSIRSIGVRLMMVRLLDTYARKSIKC